MLETKQSRIVAILSIILILFYPIFIGVNIASTSNLTLGFIVWAIVTMLSIPAAIMIIYDVNCTVLGNCSVWGWIKTLIYILITIGLIVILLGIIYMKKQNQEIKKDEENTKTDKS